jgi:hypothetical protein
MIGDTPIINEFQSASTERFINRSVQPVVAASEDKADVFRFNFVNPRLNIRFSPKRTFERSFARAYTNVNIAVSN